jgi:CDP-diglyceride synthetase
MLRHAFEIYFLHPPFSISEQFKKGYVFIKQEMVLQEAFWLFLVALVFFVGVFVRNIFKFSSVKTNSLKNYYLWATIISFVLIVSLVFGLLNQYVPFAILFFGTMIVVIFRFGKSMKAQREETKEIVSKVKDQELTFLDIFTRTGWIKMALKFGTTEAMFLIFFIEVIMLLALFFIIKLFIYQKFTIINIITYTLVLSIFGTIIFYQTLKKIKKQ